MPVTALQPLDLWEGIYLSPVTYVEYLGGLTPGTEVWSVCKPNCVIVQRGDCVNRNAANLLGITSGCDPLHGNWMLFGDTLRVFIDLSGVTEQETPRGWPLETVIEATVECILKTAYDGSQSIARKRGMEVPVGHVDLEVRGSQAHANLSRVYAIDELKSLPSKGVFR